MLGVGKAWRPETKAWTYECAGCGRQTSVTAGTIMHHSKLPLTAWMGSHQISGPEPNGISAFAVAAPAWFWLLQDGVADLRQAALQHARAGPQPAGCLSLPLSGEARRKILWDNCARLYAIETPAMPPTQEQKTVSAAE